MDHRVLVIVHLFGLYISSSLLLEYHFINLTMSWTDAQRHCRLRYTDLATIETMGDVNKLNTLETDGASQAWIGLTDDPRSVRQMAVEGNSWRWSAISGTSQISFQSWRDGPPSSGDDCGEVYDDGMWENYDCEAGQNFVCFDDTDPDKKDFIFIDKELPWTDAQAYCRKHHTDLAKIETAEENDEVMSLISSDYAWMGLHRAMWGWSDNSISSFTYWKPGHPSNYNLSERCAAVFPQSGLWYDASCEDELPFFCYGDLKLKMMVMSVKFQTDANMTDPVTSAQILQQLCANLTDQGLSDIQLNWKIQPIKQEEVETNITDLQ